MKPIVDAVDRLGFAAWADNLIADAMENMAGEGRLELDAEQDDVTMVIRDEGGKAVAHVRAYVEGRGWQYHDRVVQLKGGQP